MYRVQSLGILLGLIALFALIGYTLFGLSGALLVLGVGAVFNVLAVGNAPRWILAFHRARALDAWEAPELHRVAAGLASRAGIPVPALAIYPSEIPNAFAVGTNRDQGVVAISSGLLKILDLREVSGVLAHEFAHLKNRDSLLSLSAGLFVQAISLVSNIFGILVLLLFLSGAWLAVGASMLPLALMVGAAPYAAYALQAALMRTRERLADQDAALLTGDPGGLASGLLKLERYSRYLRGVYRRFRFIYTSEGEAGSTWLRTHPATEERVARLLEMERKTLRHPAANTRGMPIRMAIG
jgi:heat shock protein HtpX